MYMYDRTVRYIRRRDREEEDFKILTGIDGIQRHSLYRFRSIGNDNLPTKACGKHPIIESLWPERYAGKRKVLDELSHLFLAIEHLLVVEVSVLDIGAEEPHRLVDASTLHLFVEIPRNPAGRRRRLALKVRLGRRLDPRRHRLEQILGGISRLEQWFGNFSHELNFPGIVELHERRPAQSLLVAARPRPGESARTVAVADHVDAEPGVVLPLALTDLEHHVLPYGCWARKGLRHVAVLVDCIGGADVGKGSGTSLHGDGTRHTPARVKMSEGIS